MVLVKAASPVDERFATKTLPLVPMDSDPIATSPELPSGATTAPK